MSRQVSLYAYELELPGSIQIVRLKPVLLFDPEVAYPMVGQRVEPSPLVEVDGGEPYQVSSAEDSQVYRNQLQYLIRWMGYDSLRWEPAKIVDGLDAVGEFHPGYPRKPGPLENVLRGLQTQGGHTVTVLDRIEILRISDWIRRGCGMNCVTERRRRWEMQRKLRGGGGIIWYDKEVD